MGLYDCTLLFCESEGAGVRDLEREWLRSECELELSVR